MPSVAIGAELGAENALFWPCGGAVGIAAIGLARWGAIAWASGLNPVVIDATLPIPCPGRPTSEEDTEAFVTFAQVRRIGVHEIHDARLTPMILLIGPRDVQVADMQPDGDICAVRHGRLHDPGHKECGNAQGRVRSGLRYPRPVRSSDDGLRALLSLS